MTLIEAAPSTFYEAATICNNAAASFFDGYVAQMKVLSGTEGMAGTVGAGKEWATSYDQQVKETNALVTAVVMAIDNYCGVLQQLGHNYALSDHDPNSGAAAPQKPAALPLAYDVCPVPPPSAGGTGEGIIDDGLELVSKVGIDLPAPDGNTDDLDTAARAWNTLATAAASTALLSELERAAVLFQNVTAPESSFVDEDIRELKSGADDLLATFADLSTACAEQRVAMADLRTQLKDTLRNLAEEIAKEIAITLLLTATATVIGFGIGGAAVSAVRAGKFADKMKDTVDAIRRTVAGSKLKRVVTLQRSTGNTRAKLQRIIDLVKKRGDDVKKAPTSLKKQLDEATTWPKGNLPTQNGPPNGYLVKRDAQGNITHYSYYDADGIATKRVDLVGKPHLDKANQQSIPTPHVVTVERNVNPKTGEVFGRTLRDSVRPANPEEIP